MMKTSHNIPLSKLYDSSAQILPIIIAAIALHGHLENVGFLFFLVFCFIRYIDYSCTSLQTCGLDKKKTNTLHYGYEVIDMSKCYFDCLNHINIYIILIGI